MTKKKAVGKTGQGEKTAIEAAAGDQATAPGRGENPANEVVAKTHGARARREQVRQPARRKLAPRQPTAGAGVGPDGVERAIAALREEIDGLKDVVQRLVSPLAGAADVPLEGAVDSLRRLLSELIERRMESAITDLAEVRRAAAASAAGGAVVERLDQLLEKFGAVRFEAEAMDMVDPLIHVVLEERRDAEAPDGVILEALRPGYRTGRGLVVCKAAVAVNRRA